MKFLNILCLLAISFSLPAQQINWDNSKTPLIPIEIKESVEAEIHDYLSEFDLLTQQAFVLSAYEVAKSGWHHITLDHIVDDIPVFGEKIKIHLDVGKEIRFLSGIPSKIQAHENVNILNQQQVEEIALNHFESVSGNVISSNQRELHLTYYEDVLCYYMSLQSPQSETGFQYFINATTGKIINTISTIHHVAVPGTGKSRYYGIVDITIDSIMPDSFVLRDPTRTLDGLTIGFFDDNKITSQTSHFDLDSTQNLDAAIDIMYGVSKVYDLLRDSFDWFSYNNLDESFSIVMIPNLSNASWYPDHGLAAFGLGGCPLGPFTTVDIIGHELMHGVIEHSSDLFYWGESGGINESLADIMGKICEYYITPNDFSWEMARRVYEGSGLPPLRNMADPELVGDPDHYFPVGSFDNLEVHSGSAIGNLWFTRLVDGFQGRTGLDSIAYDINNTSMDTLSQIVFHANRYYLLPFNKYSSFRSATERSVIELYGDDSYLLPLVTTAWESVGVPLLNEELPIDLVLSCDTQRSSCHTSDNAIDLRLTNNSKKEYEPDNDDFIHILGAKIDTLINITDTLSRSSSTNIRLPATYFETGYDTLSFEIVADDLLPHNNSCETPVFFDPDLHPYNLSINSIRVIEDCFMFSYNLVYNLKNEGCESIPSGEPIKVKLTDDQGNSRLVDHILSYNMTTGYSSQNIIQLENAELQSQSFELEILYDNDEDDSDNFARSIGRDTIWREGFQADFEVDNIFEYQFNSRPTVTTDTFSIQEYMGSKMLFFTSLGNPNSTNCPAYFGESSLNTCIDLTGVLSPKLSFDLALLRNDHAEYASLESSTITVLWRDMSLNQDQEVINGLPEAMINNLEIDMPSDFIGELIFFFHCRLGDGTLDGSILDKDGILLDNIKINAEPLQTYQEEKEKTVNIYPNPGSQSVLIDTRKLITEIKILDVNGRECLQNSGMDLTTIDISSLPNGYYLVKLTTIDKITYTSQFVKLE